MQNYWKIKKEMLYGGHLNSRERRICVWLSRWLIARVSLGIMYIISVFLKDLTNVSVIITVDVKVYTEATLSSFSLHLAQFRSLTHFLSLLLLSLSLSFSLSLCLSSISLKIIRARTISLIRDYIKHILNNWKQRVEQALKKKNFFFEHTYRCIKPRC